jgi:holo-[acyl-carrier protein] synthase
VNIVGLGLDATEVDRIAQSLERYGERFLRRVFTDQEIAYCMRRRNPAPHLAGRFAAKEAGMKAIGTGHAFGVLWRDLEVVRHGGPPQLKFHNAAGRHFERLGATRALLTITHTDSLALAHVILVSDAGNRG